MNKYLTIDDENNCPPTSAEESFTYDDDGNLTSDERYTYTWDAENRLIQIVTTREGDPAWRDKKLTFKYDYMGRRVEKSYYIANTSHEWEINTHERFVYDQWNPVLVLNGQDGNAVLRKYTWGLDLSGLAWNGTVAGIHGAGGINGLLACVDSLYELTAWYFYDGNGNVVQLVDPSDPDGTLHANYEYDAYGNTLAESGSYGTLNAFQFSTKYRDRETGGSTFKGAVGNTGLYYYGYRYYSPRLGRWMSRDPIEEAGSLNLYLNVYNEPTGAIDPLGDNPVVIRLLQMLQELIRTRGNLLAEIGRVQAALARLWTQLGAELSKRCRDLDIIAALQNQIAYLQGQLAQLQRQLSDVLRQIADIIRQIIGRN